MQPLTFWLLTMGATAAAAAETPWSTTSRHRSVNVFLQWIRDLLHLPIHRLFGCWQTKCCGRTGPTDWLKNSYLISLSLDESLSVLPCSCFSWSEGVDQSPWCTERLNVSQHLDTAETPLFGTGNSSYDQVTRCLWLYLFICFVIFFCYLCLLLQGCKQTLSDWLQKNIVTIVAMDLSLLGVQVRGAHSQLIHTRITHFTPAPYLIHYTVTSVSQQSKLTKTKHTWFALDSNL